MKYNYLIIFLSLIGIFFIVRRKIPVLISLGESEEGLSVLRQFRLGRLNFFQIFQVYRFAHYILTAVEKFLRKSKVVFLKIDNMIAAWLRLLKNKSQSLRFKSQYPAILHRKKREKEFFDNDTRV